jgi:hypothetical protein
MFECDGSVCVSNVLIKNLLTGLNVLGSGSAHVHAPHVIIIRQQYCLTRLARLQVAASSAFVKHAANFVPKYISPQLWRAQRQDMLAETNTPNKIMILAASS